MTIGLGLTLACFHFFYQPVADNLFQFYVLPVIGLSVLFYLIYFKDIIGEADFQGDGKYYYPHLYFVGTHYTPVGFIYVSEYLSHKSEHPDFLIYFGIFAAGYLLMLFIGWKITQYGNEEWHLRDTD
jgi:hypothetical protein